MNNSEIEKQIMEQQSEDEQKAHSAACHGLTSEIVMETKRLQADCHYVVAAIMKESKNITNQDATNVWLFKKLAEFEIRLRKAEQSNVRDMVFGCR